MRSTLKLIGTIAFAVIIAFSMASCGDLAKGVTTIDIDPQLVSPSGEKGAWAGGVHVILWGDLAPNDVKETFTFTGEKLTFTKDSIVGAGEAAEDLSDWFDGLIARYDVHGGFALDITANKEEIKYAVNQRGGKDLYKVDDTNYKVESAAQDILKYEVIKTDKANEFDVDKYELFIYSRYNKGTKDDPEWSTGDEWQIFWYGKWADTVDTTLWFNPDNPAHQ